MLTYIKVVVGQAGRCGERTPGYWHSTLGQLLSLQLMLLQSHFGVCFDLQFMDLQAEFVVSLTGLLLGLQL